MVGSYFFAQGHALKLMSDYTDLFATTVTNTVAGDPSHVCFQSADQGCSLLCIGNQFCELTGFQGLTGAWGRLELRPALPGNYYCFHLYAPASFADAMTGTHPDVLPICLDQKSGCLVQCLPGPGCEPAVLALQTASSAHLLQEIIELTQQTFQQRGVFSGLNTLVKMQMLAFGASHISESQMQKRDAEEEKLVFLEDSLDFARHQLQSSLAAAGADAAHGLPEACMPASSSCTPGTPVKSNSSLGSTISSWLSPGSAGSLSCNSEASTTALKSESSLECIISSFRESLLSLDIADIGSDTPKGIVDDADMQNSEDSSADKPRLRKSCLQQDSIFESESERVVAIIGQT